MRHSPQQAWLAGVLLSWALGCGGGGEAGPNPPPPPPPPPAPANLQAVSALNQSATVAQTTTVTVRVTASGGSAVPGVTVSFTVTAGSGAVSPASAQTDATGQASTTWTLGTVAGQNTLSVSSGSLTALSFAATGTPGPAVAMTKLAGDQQSIRVGSTVPVAPAVVVRDAFQNPVPNVQVTFSVTSGAGTLVGTNPVSNAQGIAQVGSWTLGLFSAAQSISASATGAGQVLFTATGISGWTNSSSASIILTAVFANEGSLFGGGANWSATLLQTAPLLGIACGVTTGSILVSVFNSNLITLNGVVTFAFDNSPLQGAVWDELSPDFEILLHPGPQSATRAFVALMALSRTFTFTFRDFRGGVLFAPVFDVRGLALELPRILANCP